MHKIFFYEDEHGNSPIYNLLITISQQADKNSRINYNKINDYIHFLSEHGKAIGEPYIKHVEDDIWELRPIRNRIFFASWTNNGFILLHHYLKKTNKTPQREIDQAKRNLKDIQERGLTKQ